MTEAETEPVPTRTRVVLQMRSARPQPIALEAAIRIARAFHSDLSGIFIEDEGLGAMRNLRVARSVSFINEGVGSGSVRAHNPLADASLIAQSVKRQLLALAERSKVRATFLRREGQPTELVTSVCKTCTQGSVIALAEYFTAADMRRLAELFEQAPQIAGALLTGPNARRSKGPIVVALEDIAHLPVMLQAAHQLTTLAGEKISLVLVGNSSAELDTLEADVRQAVDGDARVDVHRGQNAFGDGRVMAEAIRALRGGFVITHTGGFFTPGKGDLRAFATALESPMLLLRG